VRKAEGCLETSNPPGVYANCREAGKILNMYIRDWVLDRGLITSKDWMRAYGRFLKLASSGPHGTGLKRTDSYPPQDIDLKEGIEDENAEHVLTVIKLLAKYAEELDRT